MAKVLFTSESVTEGHPDKICDQISDGILDAILEKDPNARVACETVATTDRVVLMGEITTTADIQYEKIARDVIREIGYNKKEYGFEADSCEIHNYIGKQSPDIAMGVDTALEQKSYHEDIGSGAGDQGMMFGYACDETRELMPLSASLAHKLAKRLTKVRKEGTLSYLRPDGKTQVTVEYIGGKPKRVDTLVISTQHDPDIELEQMFKDLYNNVIAPVVPKFLLEDTRILVNPTGRFVIGGPQGDSGLTGRKIIVDTYGGYGRHGGGAFSGKDPSKVDRSAAYAARHIAKNIVAAKLATQCEIQLAYAIGVANPVSININTYGTGTVSEAKLEKAVRSVFSLTPDGIIAELDLKRPIYRQLAAYGHMGREDLDVSWEKTDKIDELKAAVK